MKLENKILEKEVIIIKHLINNYYLDKDKYNYILMERKIKIKGVNQGTEYFETLGYYGMNLNMLLTKLVDIYCLENVMNQDFEDMLGFIREIIAVKEELIQ